MVFNPFLWGRTALLIILWLSVCGFMLSPIKAMANTYEVKGVKVDIVADSSVNARDKAFKQAQDKAFEILATRFLNSDELKTFKKPSSETIARLVRDVALVTEQASARRYVGEFNIRFKPAVTKNHFGKSPLKNEDEDKAAIPFIIPFFVQNNEWHLWDTAQNPLLKIWRAADDKNFMLPTGDTLDQMDIKKDFITAYNRGIIKRIKARYTISEIIIVVASFDPAKAPQLTIDLYRTDTQKLTKARTLEFNVTNEKNLGALIKTALPKIKEELSGNWKEEPTPPVTFTTILNDSTDKEKTYNPETDEPPQGEAYKPQAGTAAMIAQFSSMNEWIKLRRDIQQTPSVTAVKINSIKTFEAEIVVSYLDWQSLLNNLTARGLTIRSLGNNKYLIMRGR